MTADPTARRMLAAIAAGPLAWSAPKAIADVCARSVDATLDQLADMEAAGLVTTWEVGPRLFVTLTPFAAHALGLEIAEAGTAEVPYWRRTTDADVAIVEPRIPRTRPDLFVAAGLLSRDPEDEAAPHAPHKRSDRVRRRRPEPVGRNL